VCCGSATSVASILCPALAEDVAVLEADFNTCTDPRKMLAFLRTIRTTSDRKLRLFSVACVRRSWHLLDVAGQEAVELAERFADGGVSQRKLNMARVGRQKQYPAGLLPTVPGYAAWAANMTLQRRGWSAAHWAVEATLSTVVAASTGSEPWGEEVHAIRLAARNAEVACQAALLHDIFGPLPFRQITVDQSWQTSAVVALATSIYDERRWQDMPILGDALQEAGCSDAEVLAHCRGMIHARGCWLVDLLLNKE
jgi:hypothetical protein